MKKNAYWISGMAVLLAIGMSAAQARPLKVDYRLGMRYDDNVSQRSNSGDKTDSLVVFNELSLDLEKASDVGYFGLRYSGKYTWYNDRPSSKSDWRHSLNVRFRHALNPRLTLSADDSYSYVDSPDLVREDGATLRQDSSYTYNTANAALTTVVTPSLNLDWSARHSLLRYQDNSLADREDYNMVAGGAILRSLLTKDSSVYLEARYESQDYLGDGKSQAGIQYPGSQAASLNDKIPDRGSKTISGGFGLDNAFTPTVIGSLRGGFMSKDFNAANSGSESAPYGEAQVTVSPTSRTHVSFGVTYSLYQSSLISFSNQKRTSYALNLSQDIGPKVTAYVGGTYIKSEYDSAQSVDTLNPQTVSGGTEDAYDLFARLAFRLNRMHYMEVGISTTDLSSNLREDYTENRYDLSWNIRL